MALIEIDGLPSYKMVDLSMASIATSPGARTQVRVVRTASDPFLVSPE
jgi:hypothetical protein